MSVIKRCYTCEDETPYFEEFEGQYYCLRCIYSAREIARLKAENERLSDACDFYKRVLTRERNDRITYQVKRGKTIRRIRRLHRWLRKRDKALNVLVEMWAKHTRCDDCPLEYAHCLGETVPHCKDRIKAFAMREAGK